MRKSQPARPSPHHDGGLSLDKKGFKNSTLGGCIFFKKGEYLRLKVEKR